MTTKREEDYETTEMLLITLRSDATYDARIKAMTDNCHANRHDHEEVRDGTWSEEESERFHLSDELKEWGEWLIDDIADHFVDDSQAGFVGTLVRCAFDDVDWHRIAEAYLRILDENVKEDRKRVAANAPDYVDADGNEHRG